MPDHPDRDSVIRDLCTCSAVVFQGGVNPIFIWSGTLIRFLVAVAGADACWRVRRLARCSSGQGLIRIGWLDRAADQEQVQALSDRPRSQPGKALASTPLNSERMDMDIAAKSDR